MVRATPRSHVATRALINSGRLNELCDVAEELTGLVIPIRSRSRARACSRTWEARMITALVPARPSSPLAQIPCTEHLLLPGCQEPVDLPTLAAAVERAEAIERSGASDLRYAQMPRLPPLDA